MFTFLDLLMSRAFSSIVSMSSVCFILEYKKLFPLIQIIKDTFNCCKLAKPLFDYLYKIHLIKIKHIGYFVIIT